MCAVFGGCFNEPSETNVFLELLEESLLILTTERANVIPLEIALIIKAAIDYKSQLESFFNFITVCGSFEFLSSKRFSILLEQS